MSKTDPMWVFENYGAAAELIDELEAELEAARKQEPVARVGMVPGTDFKSVDFFPDLQSLPVGATLYMLPPLAWKVAVPRELLKKWATGFQCGAISQNAAVEEIRALLAKQAEVKDA